MNSKRSSNKFQVLLTNNILSRTGRPAFISSTTRTLKVKKGEEDRRHILHGATQITDVLIMALNWVIARSGKVVCEQIVDKALDNFKTQKIRFRLSKTSTLIKKVEKLIVIAFSKQENLVVASAIGNQGIEKARNSIVGIRSKLDRYCVELRDFTSIQNKTVQLIGNVLKGGDGAIAKYRLCILSLLQKSIRTAIDTLSLIRILHDFEFSCTLDIVHENTTKAQNIWGLAMAQRLMQAVYNQNPQAVFAVLI